MNPNRLVSFALAAAFLPGGATHRFLAQSVQAPMDRIGTEQTTLYAGAQPYMYNPLPELRRAVHELEKLQPDPNQDGLPDLMARVGATTKDLLRRLPDLIAHEEVTQTHWLVLRGQPSSCLDGRTCGDSWRSRQSFHYIVEAHQTPEGRMFKEYRTDLRKERVDLGTEALDSEGFVTTWIAFSPENKSESQFRYLGEQKIDGQNTFVIAFAQVPGMVRVPGMIAAVGKTIPLLYQGVAWIDQSDFMVRQLRTDILVPQPQIGLTMLTSKVYFGPVRIPELNWTLLLPRTVDVDWAVGRQVVQERHQYANYHLYHATSRLILPKP
jgi:hypothetical protein